MDSYKVFESARGFRDFIDDLSTWYLRRSRERIKDGDENAKKTLYFVLKNLAQLIAPFAPFISEEVWQKLKIEKDAESVHLSEWPKAVKKFSLRNLFRKENTNPVLENMQKTRDIVSSALKERQKAGIAVRQPLAKLTVKSAPLEASYLELIKDEVNVKEISFDEKLENDVVLDVEITAELKEEGNYRELVRAIQDMRKKAELTPSDVISLSIDTDEAGKNLIKKFEVDFKKTILVSGIKFESNDGEEVKVDALRFKVNIEK
ncbi:MAG: class I tRNA ligase family protein, partial [Patescibacteria group bacterium]